MLKITRRLGMALLLMLPLLALIWLIFFDVEVGMTQDIGFQSQVIPASDYSAVSQEVVDSAAATAAEIVGNSNEKLEEIVDQLLEMYVQAQNSDFVIIFNSGGWGWNIKQEKSGWGSILEGIKSQLESQGYQAMVLNYRRTGSGLKGVIHEFFEAATRYPHKAKELAARIKFLTDNFPELKVIVAGESTGTVISERTMVLLKNEPRVYSIQTGMPFWHKPDTNERTLLMNTNGTTPDTFSYGDIPAVLWATIRGWFGISSENDKPGNILFWLKAPGHDYSWKYPGVYNKIIDFINKNFWER